MFLTLWVFAATIAHLLGFISCGEAPLDSPPNKILHNVAELILGLLVCPMKKLVSTLKRKDCGVDSDNLKKQ